MMFHIRDREYNRGSTLVSPLLLQPFPERFGLSHSHIPLPCHNQNSQCGTRVYMHQALSSPVYVHCSAPLVLAKEAPYLRTEPHILHLNTMMQQWSKIVSTNEN